MPSPRAPVDLGNNLGERPSPARVKSLHFPLRAEPGQSARLELSDAIPGDMQMADDLLDRLGLIIVREWVTQISFSFAFSSPASIRFASATSSAGLRNA
jgi:hypothetical protein